MKCKHEYRFVSVIPNNQKMTVWYYCIYCLEQSKKGLESLIEFHTPKGLFE